jgi:hypothetical protein
MLLVLMAAVASAGAQEVVTPTPAAGSPAPTPEASSVLLAPKRAAYAPPPATDSDGQTRTVSPGVAALLAEGRPKFSPPTPTPAPVAEPVDLRDIDKPKNEIPRLPKYVVHEVKPPVFRNQDLYTAQGLIDLSFKNHPGLRIGNILGLNSRQAYEMQLEDQRTAGIADLTDTARAMARGGDAAEASYILQATQDAYTRAPDPVWAGPGGNGGFSGGGGK